MDRLLTPDRLINGHTLSFRDQPLLEELFNVLTRTTAPITIFAGAGISVDAGLPQWSDLVANMINLLSDSALKSSAERDDADLMRRAEVVEQLILSDPKNTRSKLNIVRDALYDAGPPSPGELADSIAKLVATAPTRFRIITTNFDGLLEQALQRYLEAGQVESFGLGEEPQWKLSGDQDAVGVLHVHGLLTVGDSGVDKPPLTLTEHEFHTNGPAVQRIVRDGLQDSCMVFIGVSMTDPNLVGPLWQIAHAQRGSDHGSEKVGISNGVGKASTQAPFALLVPGGKISETTAKDDYRYFVEKSRYLYQKLGLRPVFLKSYSQLVQAISDMALASHAPAGYRRRTPAGARTLRYGKRFGEILDSAYTGIGCPRRTDIPIGPAADNLTNALQECLQPRQPVGKLLQSLQRECIKQGLSVDSAERFGLALWLRVRGHNRQAAPYAIRLVGTSYVTFAESWMMPVQESILPGSASPAALSLFHGTSSMSNSVDRPWRGILTTPITVYGSYSDAILAKGAVPNLERLTLGVVALASSLPVVPGSSNAWATNRPNMSSVEYSDSQRSILAFAESVGRYVEVADRLRDAAVKILLPWTQADV